MPEAAKPLVLHIVADGSPGGGTTVVLGLCEDLQRDGRWEVGLVSQQGSYALQMARSLGLRHAGLAFDQGRMSLARLRGLVRLIRQWRPSIVHIHGARAGLPVVLLRLLVLRRQQMGLVYTVHGFHFARKGRVMRWLGAAAEGLIARVSHATAYVSQGDQQQARAWGIAPPDNRLTRTVFNGIEPADFLRASGPAPATELVFVGRLVRQKNPLFLVELMSALRGTGIRLGIVGGGDLEPELRRRVQAAALEDVVRFHGKLERARTLDVMRAARLCVFPSLWEGLPVTPIEAAWLGLPVIASRIPGTDEVVLDGYNGILVDGFDPAVYASHIRHLLTDHGTRNRMARNGRSLVERQFLRRRCTDGYLQLYGDVVAWPSVERLAA